MSTHLKVDTTSTQTAEDIYPYGKKYSYYVLMLLFALMAFDIMDRQVITALLGSLKAAWGLSDKQIALLMGSVNISIALLAFPSAFMVDRWSRKNMVGIMAMFWGLATLACAFTGNYAQLLFLRFLVGAGEAGYGPGSSSIIQSYFPPRKINGVLGFMLAAVPIGGLIGVIVGGVIVQHWGWRHAFGVVALPGILVAILVFFIKEPARVVITRVSEVSGQKEEMPLRAVLKKIFTTPTLVCIYLAMASTLLFTVCLANWTPSYFARMEGLSPQAAAFKAAGIMLVQAAGAWVGGIIADRAVRKSSHAHLLCAAFYMLMVFLGFGIGFTIVPQHMVYLILLISSFFSGAMFGPAYNSVMRVSPNGARATAIGLLVVVQNVLGMAFGLILSGVLSDFFMKMYTTGALTVSEHALTINNGNMAAAATAMGLKAALATLSVSPLIAAVLFYAASRFYKKDCDLADKF